MCSLWCNLAFRVDNFKRSSIIWSIYAINNSMKLVYGRFLSLFFFFFYLNIHIIYETNIPYNTKITDISYILTFFTIRTYLQKPILLTRVTILKAPILLLLPTIHNILIVTLLTILNITYNTIIAITLQYIILRRAGK